MILVPVKNLAQAKQRLGSAMPQSARTQLAQAMTHDVLSAITEWGKMPCAVVTGDGWVRDLAGRLGIEVMADPHDAGETGAIEMATRNCVARGCEFTLVLPADIPLLGMADLDAIAGHRPARGSLLVPAADGRGTNAALRSPADLFPLRFGNDSFLPHMAAARGTDLPCVVIDLPGIALDVDRPEDLPQLALEPGETLAQQFVREFLRREELLPTGSGPA